MTFGGRGRLGPSSASWDGCRAKKLLEGFGIPSVVAPRLDLVASRFHRAVFSQEHTHTERSWVGGVERPPPSLSSWAVGVGGLIQGHEWASVWICIWGGLFGFGGGGWGTALQSWQGSHQTSIPGHAVEQTASLQQLRGGAVLQDLSLVQDDHPAGQTKT